MQKKLSKILTTIFLIAFIFLLVAPNVGSAAKLNGTCSADDPCEEGSCYEKTCLLFAPQVKIPGLNYAKVQPQGSTAPIGEYINAIYKYAIGIVGILAAVVLMFGGVMWLTAGGNAERVGNAKSWIGAALTGLVLTLASYTILYTVNPDLVNFKITKIQDVEDNSGGEEVKGCCTKFNGTCTSVTQKECMSETLDKPAKEKNDFNSKKICKNNKCIQKDAEILGCCQCEEIGHSSILTKCENITENDYNSNNCESYCNKDSLQNSSIENNAKCEGKKCIPSI